MEESYYNETIFSDTNTTFPNAPVLYKNRPPQYEWYNKCWPHLVFVNKKVTLQSARRFLIHARFNKETGTVLAISKNLLWFLARACALSRYKDALMAGALCQNISDSARPIKVTPLKTILKEFTRMRKKKRYLNPTACITCGTQTQHIVYGTTICQLCANSRLAFGDTFYTITFLETCLDPLFYKECILPMTRHQIYYFLCGCVYTHYWTSYAQPSKYITIGLCLSSQLIHTALLHPDLLTNKMLIELRASAWTDTCISSRIYDQLLFITKHLSVDKKSTFLQQLFNHRLQLNLQRYGWDRTPLPRAPLDCIIYHCIGKDTMGRTYIRPLSWTIPFVPFLYYINRIEKALTILLRECYIVLLYLAIHPIKIHVHHMPPYQMSTQPPSVSYTNPTQSNFRQFFLNIYPAEYLTWAQLATILLTRPTEIHLYGNYVTAYCGIKHHTLPEISHGAVFTYLCDLAFEGNPTFFAGSVEHHLPTAQATINTNNSVVYAFNATYAEHLASSDWIGQDTAFMQTCYHHYRTLPLLKRCLCQPSTQILPWVLQNRVLKETILMMRDLNRMPVIDNPPSLDV